MNVWIAVVLAGVVSYLLRLAPVVLLSRVESPAWLDRAGGLLGPVAFAVLVAAALAGSVGGAGGMAPPLAAVAVTGAVMWLRRSATLALVAGVVTLWTLGALLG
jgi:branched-subunit amino acid transport protein